MSTLAIDIGGTKILVALVDAAEVIEHQEIATPRHRGAEHWCAVLAELTQPWRGRYAAAGAAVSGLVDAGYWSALNPSTLSLADNFPLEQRLQVQLGCPVAAVNDAHAATWAEYRFGAAQCSDCVYLTISTGIGGGAVINGRLLTGRYGLALSAGQLRCYTDANSCSNTDTNTDTDLRVEDLAAGRWIAARADDAGHAGDARTVFTAAAAGQCWAEAIIDASANRVALLLRNLQLILAPERIVIGGGIGLAAGYLEHLRARLSTLPAAERPTLYASGLGKHAGIIGAADLAQQKRPTINH